MNNGGCQTQRNRTDHLINVALLVGFIIAVCHDYGWYIAAISTILVVVINEGLSRAFLNAGRTQTRNRSHYRP